MSMSEAPGLLHSLLPSRACGFLNVAIRLDNHLTGLEMDVLDARYISRRWIDPCAVFWLRTAFNCSDHNVEGEVLTCKKMPG